MNTPDIYKQVLEHMDRTGDVVRLQPTGFLPPPEEGELYERLVDALITYGRSIGRDFTIASTLYRGLVPKTAEVEAALARIRVAHARCVVAHGLQNTNDELASLLLVAEGPTHRD